MLVNRHTYWYFVGIFPEKFCEEIKRFAIELAKKEKAETGNRDDPNSDKYTVFKKRSLKKLHKTRKSIITWLDEPWIHIELNRAARVANEHSGWGRKWSRQESIQFTEYNRGEHYGWHQDRWEEPLNSPGHFLHNTNRQLSMTINLSDPKDYDGGYLELCVIKDGKLKKMKVKEILPKGSVCVFPSETWHRVTPVTRGKRTSLVKWLSG